MITNVEDLKFLIAPVIAQSPSEQAKFYELFDRYLEEIREFPELPEPPKLPKWYERIPKWIYYLIGFLFIGYFGFVADTVIDDLTKLEPEVSFLFSRL